MSEINRRDINRCTCHCGGDMFYRHLHAASCPVSVDGEEAPISENAALRAEIERLRRELDETVKRNRDDSIIMALGASQTVSFAEQLAVAKVRVRELEQERDEARTLAECNMAGLISVQQQLAASQAELAAHKALVIKLLRQRGRLKGCLKAHMALAAQIRYAEPELSHYRQITAEAQRALRGAEEEPTNAEGPAIDPPARGDFPPEPS